MWSFSRPSLFWVWSVKNLTAFQHQPSAAICQCLHPFPKTLHWWMPQLCALVRVISSAGMSFPINTIPTNYHLSKPSSTFISSMTKGQLSGPYWFLLKTSNRCTIKGLQVNEWRSYCFPSAHRISRVTVLGLILLARFVLSVYHRVYTKVSFSMHAMTWKMKGRFVGFQYSYWVFCSFVLPWNEKVDSWI